MDKHEHLFEYSGEKMRKNTEFDRIFARIFREKYPESPCNPCEESV